MAQIGYSKKVMEHFMNPRNVGTIENPDGHGKVGNPVCGDLMEMFIEIKDNVITDIKFQTFGCGSAIATSSMVIELAKGMNIDEAMKITRSDVASELDGLPPQKMHCSNLAADALHEAIKDYMSKKETTERGSKSKSKDSRVKGGEKDVSKNYGSIGRLRAG